MKEFEIYFRDLNSVAQMQLLVMFQTTEDSENWDTQPLATICRDDDPGVAIDYVEYLNKER